jgi:biopolymer transport protein ExbD
MKTRQIEELLAPTFASLFLVLSLCAVLVRARPFVGLQIPLLQVHTPGKWADCGETRALVVSLLKTGELKISQDPITGTELTAKIGSIMKNRADRPVYVLADSGVSYQQVVSLFDRINGSARGIQIGLLSPYILQALGSGYEGPCSLDWPSYVFRT